MDTKKNEILTRTRSRKSPKARIPKQHANTKTIIPTASSPVENFKINLKNMY